MVTCSLHGSQFDITNGRVVRWLKGRVMSKLGGVFKPSKGLRVHNVKVEEGKVLVEV